MFFLKHIRNNMSTAIEFDHVGKQYRLGLVSTKTLSHDLNRWWQMSVLRKGDPYLKIGEVNDRSKAGNSEYVWALRDIDFKIERGDVVGIIGKNGAGKSTLLKLLSKVTGPTTGFIRARGRIGALLEVGTGFHPEMTGRENIYMNGAIMGMSKSEVSRKLDEIIDFSGCERYIDTPVKRYSSGMTVRLGFAVAAHLEPEILVVDEVLAVGDAEFQKKAIGKMQDVSRGEGRTVLFVSHNMQSIRNLCRQCVLLENGHVKKIGDTDEIVDYYIDNHFSKYNQIDEVENAAFRRRGQSSRELEFLSVKRLSAFSIDSCDSLEFEIRIKVNKRIEHFQIASFIDDVGRATERVGMASSDILDVPSGKDFFTVRVSIRNHNLSKSRYIMDFWLCLGDVSSSFRVYDRVYDTVTFEVNRLKGKYIVSWEKGYGQNFYVDSQYIVE